jgi:glycosyltransferase involved in cell wall biosynthesis
LHGSFLLYGGRIDPGKGCEELLEYFQEYVRQGGDATLALMGTKLMPLPDDPHVRFAGVLPDEERLHALEAASVVVVPSPYESLSLLALEAFAVGTPVLANARSEVLVEHCRRSNAGLYYENRWEFVEAAQLLLNDAHLRRKMSVQGKAYIDRYYRWGTILSKYERLMSRLRGVPRDIERPVERHDRSDGRDRGTQGNRDRGRDPRRGREGRRDDTRRDQRRSGPRPRR